MATYWTLLTRGKEDMIKSVEVVDHVISDHLTIQFELQNQKSPPETKSVTFRKLKSVNKDTLKNDMKTRLASVATSGSANDAVSIYNATLRDVINNHAPMYTKDVIVRPIAPRYGDEIQEARRKRRRCERHWRKTKFEIDRQLYKEQRDLVADKINEARQNYYKKKSTKSKSMLATRKSCLR